MFCFLLMLMLWNQRRKKRVLFLFIQLKRGPKMSSNDIMLSKCTSNSPTAVKRKWPVVFQVKFRNPDDDGILSQSFGMANLIDNVPIVLDTFILGCPPLALYSKEFVSDIFNVEYHQKNCQRKQTSDAFLPGAKIAKTKNGQ